MKHWVSQKQNQGDSVNMQVSKYIFAFNTYTIYVHSYIYIYIHTYHIVIVSRTILFRSKVLGRLTRRRRPKSSSDREEMQRCSAPLSLLMARAPLWCTEIHIELMWLLTSKQSWENTFCQTSMMVNSSGRFGPLYQTKSVETCGQSPKEVDLEVDTANAAFLKQWPSSNHWKCVCVCVAPVWMYSYLNTRELAEHWHHGLEFSSTFWNAPRVCVIQNCNCTSSQSRILNWIKQCLPHSMSDTCMRNASLSRAHA